MLERREYERRIRELEEMLVSVLVVDRCVC